MRTIIAPAKLMAHHVLVDLLPSPGHGILRFGQSNFNGCFPSSSRHIAHAKSRHAGSQQHEEKRILSWLYLLNEVDEQIAALPIARYFPFQEDG
ncbi:hypothetical protein ABE453_03130 [Brevundimonas diminuta]|uniref:hypothetical protein n=1 Tax=Brevundimonas diminuta TaxID=293 RepID=UPI00320AB5A9